MFSVETVAIETYIFMCTVCITQQFVQLCFCGVSDRRTEVSYTGIERKRRADARGLN